MDCNCYAYALRVSMSGQLQPGKADRESARLGQGSGIAAKAGWSPYTQDELTRVQSLIGKSGNRPEDLGVHKMRKGDQGSLQG